MPSSMRIFLAVLGVASAELNFLIMGDWGGDERSPYTTRGEVATAVSMGEEAGKIGAKFSLALGDNFYSHGLQGDEFDPRFQHTFEDVFSSSNLQGPNFFRVIVGNHDHLGNTTAQIAYSAHSERWHLPALWYNFVEEVDDQGTTAEFVMIDTVTLSGPSACPLSGEQWLGSDKRMQQYRDNQLAQTQYEWLEATLAASTADFLFVAGHYPVWSVCEHGPTTHLIKNLKPLLEKYRVSAYLAGHDHCEEHIDEGTGVQYHLVGAAHGSNGEAPNTDKVPAEQLKFLDAGEAVASHNIGRGAAALNSQGGFASMSISKDGGAVVKHFRCTDRSYEARYTAEAIPSRGSAPPPSPTPVPTPIPAPMPDGTWECRTNQVGNIGKGKNLGRTGADISSCQQACDNTEDCAAIFWHKTDSHCHVLSGSFSYEDWTATLQEDSERDSCFRKSHAVVV